MTAETVRGVLTGRLQTHEAVDAALVELDALVADREDALARAASMQEASIRLKSEWEAERDALAARLAEAEDARAALGRAISTEGKQRVAAEARVAALTEALRSAQFFITVSLPLIDQHDISGEGIEIGGEVLAKIEALIGPYETGMLRAAAADRPEGTTP